MGSDYNCCYSLYSVVYYGQSKSAWKSLAIVFPWIQVVENTENTAWVAHTTLKGFSTLSPQTDICC